MDFDLRETIGIDFGTSFSTVSKYENGKVVLVEDEFHSLYIPTYISCINGEYAFGTKAFQNACSNTGNTVYEIKRLIGHSYGDEVISKCLKQMPYDIVDDNNGGVQIAIKNGESKKQFPIVDLIFLFVHYLKGLAEESLHRRVKNCIVTVPSYFDTAQRGVIHSAVKATGLNILSILTEPTAAALAYSSVNTKYNGHTKVMAVYDFGGGTFDVSIIQSSYNTYEVIATSGDTEVGGKDLTRIVADYIEEQLLAYPAYTDYCSSKQGAEIIRGKAEEMKIDLTVNESSVAFFEKGEESVEITLTRKEFEKRIAPLVQRTIDVVLECVQFVKMKPRDIESIILIGGSSFIPCIKEYLKKDFPDTQILNTIDTRAAVATGALYYACMRKEGKEFAEVSAKMVVLKNPGEMFSASSLVKKHEEVNTAVVDGVTVTLQPPPLPKEYEQTSTSFDTAVAIIDETLKKYPQCPDSVSIYEVLEKAGIQLDNQDLDINSIQVMDIVNHAFNQSTMASFFKEKEEIVDGDVTYSNGEYVFEGETPIFTDVTPVSVGYVDSNRHYHELIKRNTSLPISRSFKFSCSQSRNANLSLTIAESRDASSSHYSIIGCARLNNVPIPPGGDLMVIVTIAIDSNNTMTVEIREKQSEMQETYHFDRIFGANDTEVQNIYERNRSAINAYDEKSYRNYFNDKLYEKMHIMENFVRRTGDEDCKITLMEMREVLKRQDEFTVDQLKEIMGKVYAIMRMYNVD